MNGVRPHLHRTPFRQAVVRAVFQATGFKSEGNGTIPVGGAYLVGGGPRP